MQVQRKADLLMAQSWPPVQDRGRWWLLALIAVAELCLAGAEVREGIDDVLIADAVALLLAERIRWIL